MVTVITDPWALAKAFFIFLPLEALLDFGPDVLASFLYRLTGIELGVLSIGGRPGRRYVKYVRSLFPRSLESGLEEIVVTGLYYPLFEELVFRGLPYLLGMGVIGVGLGTAVWVLLHPVWRLKMLPVNATTGEKLKMFGIDVLDYSVAGAWLSWLWLNGWGVLAIIYHIFHNVVIVLPEVAPEGFSYIASKLHLPGPSGGKGELPKSPIYVHRTVKGTGKVAPYVSPDVCIAMDAYHWVQRDKNY